MDTDGRVERAELFRAKASDSFAAAQDCFACGLYRSACNRAWYGTYQMIIAGAYFNLNEAPSQGRANWRHNEAERLLSDILKKHGRRLRDGYLVDYLAFVRQWRTVADYEIDGDNFISTEKVQRCLELAERVNRVVCEVSGWTSPVRANSK